MRRRRFMLSAAAAAVGVPLFGLAGCGGGGGDDGPQPIPTSKSVLRFPVDYYAHRGAPTEWWWHTGTLRAGNRVFGFEINAASFAGSQPAGFAFSQISLSDIANNRYYQRTLPYLMPFGFDPETWAEHDPTKDWSAHLGSATNMLSAIDVTNPGSGYTSDPTVEISGGGGALALAAPVRDAATGTITAILLLSPGIGFSSVPTVTITGGGGTGATAKAVHSYVAMRAQAADPSKNMTVKALLVDQATSTKVDFDLALSLQGPKFIVWGTGVKEGPGTLPPLERNNYYYSFTNLQTTGSITIGAEKLAVTGVTWMDHEYGAFGSAQNPVKWILQDMQLDNGLRISNYTVAEPKHGQRTGGEATVMDVDGTTYLVPSFVTPFGRTWTSPQSGRTFFLELRVEIPSFNANIVVTSLMDAQEFPAVGAPVYEGIAGAVGVFQGRAVAGTAWNEQALD
jgi:predicted secreted hydrolase